MTQIYEWTPEILKKVRETCRYCAEEQANVWKNVINHKLAVDNLCKKHPSFPRKKYEKINNQLHYTSPPSLLDLCIYLKYLLHHMDNIQHVQNKLQNYINTPNNENITQLIVLGNYFSTTKWSSKSTCMTFCWSISYKTKPTSLIHSYRTICGHG